MSANLIRAYFHLGESDTMKSPTGDAIVMATARTSVDELYHILRKQDVSTETIGCATAPRTVYEATLEGHKAARQLGRRADLLVSS